MNQALQNPKVRIILEDNKIISLELFPNIAPKTVDNFLKLVDEHFYDGVCFHRVIENFMIQTGGYYVKGNEIMEKEKTPTIVGEFASNNHKNSLRHELGVISMARLGNDNNSASSQFFICSAKALHLDTNYAAFGKTIDEVSNEAVLAISKAPTVSVDPSLANFPYPVINIKTVERIK